MQKYTDEVILRSFSQLLICKKYFFTTNMQDFFAEPDFFLSRTAGPFFKDKPGDTTTVGVIEIDGKKLVVKRYNIKSFWHALKKIFRQSRAMRSWLNSHYLSSHGIDTPKPVAVLIKRWGFWRKTTYFITEFVEGERGSEFFLEQTKTNINEWQIIIKYILLLVDKLQTALITHDDFQHRNMLIVNYKPCLLDLDHMRIHRYRSWWFRHNLRKDLEHFVALLEVNPKVQQMFREAFSNRLSS